MGKDRRVGKGQVIIIIIVHFMRAAYRLWHSTVQDLGIPPIFSFSLHCFSASILVRSTSARGRLERKVEEEKARKMAEMDNFRRDMVAWKDQAEKINTVRWEAAQERRLFQTKVFRLEQQAVALGG